MSGKERRREDLLEDASLQIRAGVVLRPKDWRRMSTEQRAAWIVARERSHLGPQDAELGDDVTAALRESAVRASGKAV